MEQLATDSIEKSYGGRKIVDRVSIEVSRGEIVGLLGPNGAGKTTSFYMVVGLITPDNGRVMLNQVDITRMPMYERARNSIGYLAQEPSIFRNMTVEDNIMAVLEFMPISKKERIERVEELLEELQITKVRKTLGISLSGGERRRAEIARALATVPKFLLLDEPFAGVDPIAVADIQSIILMLKKKNLGVLITDHNVRETLRITDHSYIMNEGRILVQGKAEDLINDPVARKIYLGDQFTL
ncbi:MAG: LPS export ABC transporter ATP-binding protein [Candidatus Wallbacteria bacterium HGW-Wallbacteria-1]|jgi:lipopolysaccharide export system ATP-binding protein|uniref:LPS export ABC transporter ATP-binding protein n=1 Tax=Candidatus Wallbacteria bacterium HGW-Wallbacteria-1 TaxID=2013854 RepID=A0A2N1PT35_9BACT|nr:MAG: LPS export ABC transporter ATP-binding protein [Candidatus Wallbacteria bacterium HGW-Wallbacteria-1]